MKAILKLPFVFLFGLFPVIGNAQYITISGYITDFLTGGAIENATVFEKSSGIGTITDKDGFYKLVLRPGKMNITFSDNGFEAFVQKLTVTNDTTLMIQLKSEKWVKEHEKAEADLQTGIGDKKIPEERKKFWFF
ncbi:carboxypeptidase-like regulatory domain-containing protein [Maribellus maritimus]|uniref:carboxypeptidase-like regulatory domain-containing protein n=1 Tax=Maribellus maritimus TaxID=2870838 RepID=UPI001EE9BB05|nr:carboxypeptidase-like regulatory domain-containing protein [Maribellus maritimus]MCG6188871.1 carboxypeptidase-like regulatory domain-containing protein [Maribellus maritimus]